MGEALIVRRGGKGGGAELNIDYGTSAPSDTTKLWVPLASKPSAVECSPAMQYGSEYVTEYVGTLTKAQYGVACASVGTKVYFFGGSSDKSAIDVFDTETGVVERLSVSLSTTIGHSARAAAIGSKIYILGGRNGPTYVKAIQVFDVNTQTVTTLSATIDSNCATQNFAIAAVGKVIYMFGGERSGHQGIDTIGKFDTETEIFTKLSAKLPVEVNTPVAAAVGKMIYIFGGSYDSTRCSYGWGFDTETETITSYGNPLRSPVYGSGIGAVGKKIYILGGSANKGYIQIFDTETKSVTVSESQFSKNLCSSQLYGATSAVVGTKIYVHPGYSSVVADIHCFTAETVLAENNLFLQTDFGFDGFWSAVKGKDFDVKVKLLNAYIGNSNNIAQLTDAFRYDESLASWVNLDGESMTADMLNALATLGVT